MSDFAQVDDKTIEALKKAYSHMKSLMEEKKSLSEDIREIKVKLGKEIGFSVTDINDIIKTIQGVEKGKVDDSLVKIARRVLGIA